MEEQTIYNLLAWENDTLTINGCSVASWMIKCIYSEVPTKTDLTIIHQWLVHRSWFVDIPWVQLFFLSPSIFLPSFSFYLFILTMCMEVPKKRAPEPQEQELQAVVSHSVGAGNWTLSNPAPFFLFFFPSFPSSSASLLSFSTLSYMISFCNPDGQELTAEPKLTSKQSSCLNLSKDLKYRSWTTTPGFDLLFFFFCLRAQRPFDWGRVRLKLPSSNLHVRQEAVSHQLTLQMGKCTKHLV